MKDKFCCNFVFCLDLSSDHLEIFKKNIAKLYRNTVETFYREYHYYGAYLEVRVKLICFFELHNETKIYEGEWMCQRDIDYNEKIELLKSFSLDVHLLTDGEYRFFRYLKNIQRKNGTSSIKSATSSLLQAIRILQNIDPETRFRRNVVGIFTSAFSLKEEELFLNEIDNVWKNLNHRKRLLIQAPEGFPWTEINLCLDHTFYDPSLDNFDESTTEDVSQAILIDL